MNALGQTSVELYEMLHNDCGPKAKASLERVKQSCDDIVLMKGTLNYSRVAELTTKRFGGPKKQSIQNSRSLKSYIAKRMDEYDEERWKGGQHNPASKGDKRHENGYPTDGLDIKTRVYIDRIRDIVKRLEEENKYLSQLLEKETRENPISFSEAIAGGVQQDGSVDLSLIHTNSEPSFLKAALQKILGVDQSVGELKRFEVLVRGERRKLVCNDGGVEMTLVQPNEWQQLVEWVTYDLDR